MLEAKASIPVPNDDFEKRNFANDPDSQEQLGPRREERPDHVRERGKSYDDRLSDGYRMMNLGGDGE